MVISVIIPVYNAEESIEKCLDSIKNQTWKGEFEIIVINDGSADRSGEILENYRKKNPEMPIQLINQENGGVSKARNTGLKIAKGDYIALLDSDDEWLPEKTEKQMKYLVNQNFGVDFLASLWNDDKDNGITVEYLIKTFRTIHELTLEFNSKHLNKEEFIVFSVK